MSRHRVLEFRGRVACRRETAGPLGLTLLGRTVDRPAELTCVALACAAPPDLPEALRDPTLVQRDAQRFELRSAERAWTLIAPAIHVHRDVGESFYRAVPGRPAPWRKRLFWRAVLAAAGSAAGRRLLLALRSR